MQETRSLYLQKHGQDSQKNIFQGVVPPDLPPSGPFRGSDPMCEFIIFKLHQNEDLCKKLEDSILKNIDGILKRTFLRGWYPQIYPLQSPSEGLTPCVSLRSSHQNEDLCKKLEVSILKNIDRILKKTFLRGWYTLI